MSTNTPGTTFEIKATGGRYGVLLIEPKWTRNKQAHWYLCRVITQNEFCLEFERVARFKSEQEARAFVKWMEEVVDSV